MTDEYYTSETSVVVEKLSVFDACANNEPDLKMLFALAPVYATHANSDDSGLVEIPARERALNWLADENFKITTGFVSVHMIVQEEINERRALRHPEPDEVYHTWSEVPEDLKWLVRHVQKDEVNNLIQRSLGGWASFQHDSLSQSENEIFTKAQFECARSLMPDVKYADTFDMAKGKWLPEVGEECLLRYYEAGENTSAEFVTAFVEAIARNGDFIVEDGEDKLLHRVPKDMVSDELRQLKTAEQVAAEERLNWISDVGIGIDQYVDPKVEIEEILGATYDYLKGQGLLTKKDSE